MSEQTKSTPETAPKDDDVEILNDHEPEKPVKIKVGNQVKDFVIREMADGDELGAYMNSVSKRMRGQGRDFTGMHADLISRCLYDAKSGARVPKAMVEKWGPKVQNRLFTICQDVNGLSDRVEDREGKD